MSMTYTQTRWSLADLFSAHDSPQFEQAFSELEASVAGFEGRREQLSPEISQEAFLAIVHEL
ncbi:MAG: hypothetical protein JSV61_10910, partial [Anaerolineales bacterium]